MAPESQAVKPMRRRSRRVRLDISIGLDTQLKVMQIGTCGKDDRDKQRVPTSNRQEVQRQGRSVRRNVQSIDDTQIDVTERQELVREDILNQKTWSFKVHSEVKRKTLQMRHSCWSDLFQVFRILCADEQSL